MIDVCLLLEGTYPYVAGGVSTWVHQLISSMKEIRFGIVYIAPHSDPTRKIKYDIPENVIYLKEIFLHDYNLDKKRKRNPKPQDFQVARNFYEKIFQDDYSGFNSFLKLFRGKKSCLDTQTVFSEQASWQMLTDFYDLIEQDISFVDYFWTWRGTHLPLMQILLGEVPKSKIYHSVSTGYAGLLGCIAKHQYGGKYFLTEHGIYTHERSLEISQANWIYEKEVKNFRAEKELSFFKTWWIDIFKHMSRLAYRSTDQIFTLYEGNKIKQVLEGASPEKIGIIPNGINIAAFSQIKRQTKDIPQIGLIGRVVSIKDIKTFIHAAHIYLKKQDALFYIMGPINEEEEYYEECKNLVDQLNLQDKVIFTGRINIKEYLQFLDLVVLTSISEAQPYVILEANIVGIPIVTTDVGSCREMLEGRDEEDQKIGHSGIVTPVASPADTAKAMLKLTNDKELWNKMSKSGIERVKRYYDQDDLLAKYLNIYEQNL